MKRRTEQINSQLNMVMAGRLRSHPSMVDLTKYLKLILGRCQNSPNSVTDIRSMLINYEPVFNILSEEEGMDILRERLFTTSYRAGTIDLKAVYLKAKDGTVPHIAKDDGPMEAHIIHFQANFSNIELVKVKDLIKVLALILDYGDMSCMVEKIQISSYGLYAFAAIPKVLRK